MGVVIMELTNEVINPRLQHCGGLPQKPVLGWRFLHAVGGGESYIESQEMGTITGEDGKHMFGGNVYIGACELQLLELCSGANRRINGVAVVKQVTLPTFLVS